MQIKQLEQLELVINTNAQLGVDVDVVLAEAITKTKTDLVEAKEVFGKSVQDATLAAKLAESAAQTAVVEAKAQVEAGIKQVTEDTAKYVSTIQAEVKTATQRAEDLVGIQAQSLADFKAQYEAEKYADVVLGTDASYDGQPLVEIIAELLAKQGMKPTPKQSVMVYFSSERPGYVTTVDEKYELKVGYSVACRFDEKAIIVPTSFVLIRELATDFAEQFATVVSRLVPISAMEKVKAILG